MTVTQGEIQIPLPKRIHSWITKAYPPPRLSEKLFSRGVVPIDMGLVAIGAVTIAEIAGLAHGNPPIPLELFLPGFKSIQPIVIGMVGMRGILKTAGAIADSVEKNKRLNWPILSVTKHRIGRNFVGKDFPDMTKGEDFYGELHFSNWDDNKKFPSRKEALLRGVNEMLGLIRKCEQNDSHLKDVQVFAGHSPIINPLHLGRVLQSIGFEIKENEKPDYRGWDAWINGEYRFRKNREDTIRFIMPKATWYSGAIRRETLIANKEKLERLRDKLRKNYTT